ncbi:MAG TPA: hypothetical protein VEK57_03830 [Thermoanaerobaculia bacterium]|nr:hypothetical protein [Thermoanaerobaculia bacterium]
MRDALLECCPCEEWQGTNPILPSTRRRRRLAAGERHPSTRRGSSRADVMQLTRV